MVSGNLPELNGDNFTITENHGGITSSGNPSDYSITTTASSTANTVGTIPLQLKYKTSDITCTVDVPYKYTPSEPSVTISPSSDITVAHCLGNTTLSVTATGTSYTVYETSSIIRDDISYQWYNDESEITGKTKSSFTPPVSEPGSFTYKCRVTYTPNETYATSTTSAYVESNSVSVDVARWTLTVTDSANQSVEPKSVAGDYELNAGEAYTFALSNVDTGASNSAKTRLTWTEQINSYLSITPTLRQEPQP